MNKLEQRSNGKYIISKMAFVKISSFKRETIEMAFDFSYAMSFGKAGEHRDHRSGGTHQRKPGEIFANTFQGKLSEFALYNVLYKDFPNINKPDLETWELGKWDDTDLYVNDYFISVKSTKAFGNLLLLETKDWNDDGEYIPNLTIENAHTIYDFFVLVRLFPYCEDILRSNKLLYTQQVDKEELKNVITQQEWSYDIPGFITYDNLLIQ